MRKRNGRARGNSDVSEIRIVKSMVSVEITISFSPLYDVVVGRGSQAEDEAGAGVGQAGFPAFREALP